MPTRTRTYLAKCLILGAKNVGKTTLRKKISTHLEGFEFIEQKSHHIKVGFGSNSFFVKGRIITVQFWEITADEHASPRNAELYMENSHVAMVLCDVTNPTSIDILPHLITDFWAFNGLGIQPIVILMNKADSLPQWHLIKKMASFNYRDWLDLIPEPLQDKLVELCANVEPVLNKMGLNLGFSMCSAEQNFALTTSTRFLLRELLTVMEHRTRGLVTVDESLE